MNAVSDCRALQYGAELHSLTYITRGGFSLVYKAQVVVDGDSAGSWGSTRPCAVKVRGRKLQAHQPHRGRGAPVEPPVRRLTAPEPKLPAHTARHVSLAAGRPSLAVVRGARVATCMPCSGARPHRTPTARSYDNAALC